MLWQTKGLRETVLVFSVLLCKMPFVQNGKKKSNMEDAAEPTPCSPRNTLAAYSGVQIPLISPKSPKNHALPIDRQGVLWYAYYLHIFSL